MPEFSLAELSVLLDATLVGDESMLIHRIAPLSDAQSGDIVYVASARYLPALADCQASAVLIDQTLVEHCPENLAYLAVPKVMLAYVRLAQHFMPTPSRQTGVHKTAVTGEQCQISPKAFVGPHCVLGDGVCVSAGVHLSAGCVLADGVSVGEDTYFHPNVSVYARAKIGAGVMCHSGAVIGSDGFGYELCDGQWLKVPQLGGVVIGDQADIGANVTIDRGSLADTRIGKGVCLDNQVHVAHNVVIGDCTAIAGATIIAGSVTIGAHCMIGGGCCISGHLSIADNVILTGMSAVSKSIQAPGIYSSGQPVQTNAEWRKSVVHYRNLNKIVKRIKKLEDEKS